MSEEAKKDLGRRAVACKHWEWLPGMLTLATSRDGAWRIDGQKGSLCINGAYSEEVTGAVLSDNHLPDLADAETRACLLKLVLDAYKAKSFTVTQYNRSTNTPGARLLSYWVAEGYSRGRRTKTDGKFAHSHDDYGRLWKLGLVAALEAAK